MIGLDQKQDLSHSALNIGTLGHIDHGKTSLTRAITGQFTDRHSESIKRNMTIKLGYADAIIKRCPKCQVYTTSDKCPNDQTKTEPVMRFSMLDAPGHETLMATAIVGSSIIDAILFVIAANEPCPMPQTKEHLMIINILGIKNVIIVQTKIDIVGKEAAIAHQKKIREFVKGSAIENAPIVPVMSNLGVNIDKPLEMVVAMERPKRDLDADPIMYVVRSFDVNKPGSDATKMMGGVLGGAVAKGRFKAGQKVEIRPGIKINNKAKKEVYEAVTTTITSLNNGSESIDEAIPGGLIGVSTEIDPAFTKADGLVGNIIGIKDKMPPILNSIAIKYHKLPRDDVPEQHIVEHEPMILGIGTATVLGYVKKAKKDTIEFDLKHPICINKDMKVAVMRNLAKRWRLTGWGSIS
jgi:translation initiation factor 2 subunit 3